MVDVVGRAKALQKLAKEVGYVGLGEVVRLGTESSAAKKIVCRRGLGNMRHLEIRDLWLQKEVREGRLEMRKIAGSLTPGDCMTQTLSLADTHDRFGMMNMEMV